MKSSNVIKLVFLYLITFSFSVKSENLVPVYLPRHGHKIKYLKNTNKIAVSGLNKLEIFEKADKLDLKINEILKINNIFIITLKSNSPLDFTSRKQLFLKSISVNADFTAPVYFKGSNLTVPTGKFWIYFPAKTSDLIIKNILKKYNSDLVEIIKAKHKIAVAIPPKHTYLPDFTKKLIRDGYDATMELMRKYYPLYQPSDPYFQYQWVLNNDGTNVYQAWGNDQLVSVPMADVRAVSAWDISTGDPGVLIAVIDSGVDCSHPELTNKCTNPYNAITDIDDASPPPLSQDFSAGHGTSVAGISMGPEDGIGVVGVCPHCGLIPVRLIDTSIYLSDTMMLRAFTHAVDSGAAVINNSWGPAPDGEYFVPVSQGEEEGIIYAAGGRNGLGTLVVYAAGNESLNTKWYGQLQTGYPYVMAVAASNHLDKRSAYSNFGEEIDISAPSSDSYINPWVISLAPHGEGDWNSDYTRAFGGTSSAAPAVSGVAALIISVDPTLSATEVAVILKNSADKIDPQGGYYDIDGHSIKYGYGRVNAYAALLTASNLSYPWCDSPAASDDCSIHGDENCDGYVDESCDATDNSGSACTLASECGSETYWLCPSSGEIKNVCTWDCTEKTCATGFTCYKGLCAQECTPDRPCPSGQVCDNDTFGICRPECTDSSQCDENQECDSELHYCVLVTDGRVGSPCTGDECVGTGQVMCLGENWGFVGGYCTHSCIGDANCDGIGKCITSNMGSFCYKRCNFDGDCRPGYVCEQAGPRAGTCYKLCTNDGHCNLNMDEYANIICDTNTGRCVDNGEEPDAGTDADGDIEEDDQEVQGDLVNDTSDSTGDDIDDNGNISAGGSGCSCRSVSQKDTPFSSPVFIVMFLLFIIGFVKKRI